MVFYELLVTLRLRMDMEAVKGYEYLSRVISQAMLHDDRLRELHGQCTLKGYCFCNLYPRETDKLYRHGRVYVFHIRSLSLEFILLLKSVLRKEEAGIIAIELKTFSQRPIVQLKSLTPMVATVDNRSWTKEGGIKILLERIHVNALKKYRAFLGEMDEPVENFVESIQLLNEKPIKVPYKNNSFLANKVIIGVKSDPVSQKLAFAALGAGLLEKNSIGMGYCMYE